GPPLPHAFLQDSVGAYSTLSEAAVALFDFNPVSGIVSNPVTLLPYATLNAYPSPAFALFTDSIGYAVCFSADNSKLYYTSYTMPASSMIQFDLSSGNPNLMA